VNPATAEQVELKEAARRIVESSCREQGLEVQITDPVVIGKIAAILRVDSDPPLRRNPARVKPVETSDRSRDRDRVENRKEHSAFAA
jgi:hypothetical protein